MPRVFSGNKRNGRKLYTLWISISEPKALAKLNDLKNITLKMYDVEAADEGFHTKGYIFRKDEIYRIFIGSSNITSAALNQMARRNVLWQKNTEATLKVAGMSKDDAII